MNTIKVRLTKEEAEKFNLLKSRIGLEGKKLTPSQNAELIYLIRGFLSDIETIKGVEVCKATNLCISVGNGMYYTFANIYESIYK